MPTYDTSRGGGYANQNRPGGGRPYAAPPSRGLPPGYLKDGYFAKEGEKLVLRKEYIVDYPIMIAEALDDRDKNKSSQLRKFYDFCIRLRSIIDNGRSFREVQSELARLGPFARYAESRSRVTPVFVQFIEKNMERVHNEGDFNAFMKHFEAVIAYLKK